MLELECLVLSLLVLSMPVLSTVRDASLMLVSTFAVRLFASVYRIRYGEKHNLKVLFKCEYVER